VPQRKNKTKFFSTLRFSARSAVKRILQHQYVFGTELDLLNDFMVNTHRKRLTFCREEEIVKEKVNVQRIS